MKARLSHLLKPGVQALAGALLLAVLATPPMRALLESSMWRHMVLQFPLWMLAGALLAAVEVFLAKLRLFRVPELLAGSFVLAFLSVSAAYLVF